MKRILGTMLLLLLVATGYGKGPKYIFYFIGDGMGPSHVLGAELYLGELQGTIGRPHRFCFTQFPESAFVTTYSATNGVTDSAASGTALSTGSKSFNKAIGVGTDSLAISSVAADLAGKGMAIGVATTVPINHATPAAFYAHNINRNNYDSIAPWMLRAGYDFYAGGDVYGSNESRRIVYGKAEEMGYTVSRGYNDFCTKAGTADRMMLFQEKMATELPYAINRTKEDLTLAQITTAGIEFLKNKSKNGFFMMIEGGKIDYAAHNDDGATVFHEVQDLNAAVAVAYEFYKEHKDETLIIVTADHETGGLVLGYRGDYTLNLKALASQKVSVERMIEILQAEKETTWDRIEQLVKENIGVAVRNKKGAEEKVTVDYNLAKEIAYNAVYDLNSSAALSWASGNHSGTFVPLFAIGKGAENFNGVIDNTDIPNIIRKLKGICINDTSK